MRTAANSRSFEASKQATSSLSTDPPQNKKSSSLFAWSFAKDDLKAVAVFDRDLDTVVNTPDRAFGDLDTAFQKFFVQRIDVRNKILGIGSEPFSHGFSASSRLTIANTGLSIK
jgi:hypothetical protein